MIQNMIFVSGGVGMALFKREEKIRMSEEQFEELIQFYKKLGFSSSQSKKLAGSCFGAKVTADKNVSYKADWQFRREAKEMPLGMGAALGSGFRSFKATAPMAICPEPLEDCCAAPVEAPMPSAAEEFNAAETHDAPEIENASPLDSPQIIFSANVNTASWSYLRNNIKTGRRIDKSFVRIEEIINSYPYKLKKPKGEDLFSVNIERGDCPWNREAELLFVGLKGKKADKDIRQNIAFLVDVSGSMTDRWVLVQMSMMAIISKLKKGDVMSIIAYSDDTVTVAEKMECGNMDKCIKAVLSIDGIGGCTNGSEGLENAYSYLADNFDENGNNRIFIFTDGDFNFGVTSEGGLAEYIRQKRETGIYLSIVGYGRENFKDNKMEALARNGNGNYTFIANPSDILETLWEKLVSNLVTVAKDVKISVELNPHFVKEYRLIGYDARVLTQKEFYDTEKAVDGIGSEHNVAALIEMKRGEAVRSYSSRYVSTNAVSNDQEFAFIEIHYKTPDDENKVFTRAVTIGELDGAGDKNMAVASLLAAFGLYLRESAYKGELDKAMLNSMLSALDKNEQINTKEKDSHFDIIRKYLKS